MRRSRTATYYNCYYYCINYAEERRKVKADNGTRRAERTDRGRNAPERAGRKPTAIIIAPRPAGIWKIIL